MFRSQPLVDADPAQQCADGATPRFRTRFAPSPTGPLHLGSLVAAVGSYLAAKRAGGTWLVRIEDLDPPRAVPGSGAAILETLAAFGFEWCEPVLWQSQRLAAYTRAATQLLTAGSAYECSCSRAEIAAAHSSTEGAEELHYPGWCRDGVRAPQRRRALRLRVPVQSICFEDAIQGKLAYNVAGDVGDFVVRRRDGLFAYQLAVVVDDAAQHISHVVRGADLLSSTPRQILLQRALGVATPAYAHLPLVLDQDGVKLSKSAGAAAIDGRQPVVELWRALCLLRQDPPAHLRCGAVRTLWDWAIEHWTTAPLRGLRTAAPIP
jgi:glutamyl-Q tRNA(Asp) synthetase